MTDAAPFDRIIIVDWSAAATPSPRKPSADAIWLGEDGCPPRYFRTRAEVMAALSRICADALATGTRVLIGADFPFGYPKGFAARLTGDSGALAVWDWLGAHVVDAPDNRNNRFQLAGQINARFPGLGPFWGCPAGLSVPGLPHKGSLRQDHLMPERRVVEDRLRSTQPCWKLYTTGSVGSQALLGIAALNRLRQSFGPQLAVWPFQPPTAPVVLAEIYPSLLAPQVTAALARDPGQIKDAVQVSLLAEGFARARASGHLAQMLRPQVPVDVLAEEGWILGAGFTDALG
ncbi:hypothetical protein [Roseicitreum antarcticum]|uniref:Molybdopterin-guanine dinucleotide biosynthesis protein B n=1 Tax=Roseicitreum antarcticum TaxID=564137 RepID=A0A1H3AY06_9RHOB|nr:hypothetical protein [Roseicitreum antarcticum]SDX34602.1 molybdopterin-guanine dinucleotide biosynthesis protein B [Roseicitreum antarcticum]